MKHIFKVTLCKMLHKASLTIFSKYVLLFSIIHGHFFKIYMLYFITSAHFLLPLQVC